MCGVTRGFFANHGVKPQEYFVYFKAEHRSCGRHIECLRTMEFCTATRCGRCRIVDEWRKIRRQVVRGELLNRLLRKRG